MDSYPRKEEREEEKDFIEIQFTALGSLLNTVAVGVIIFLAVSLLNYFM